MADEDKTLTDILTDGNNDVEDDIVRGRTGGEPEVGTFTFNTTPGEFDVDSPVLPINQAARILAKRFPLGKSEFQSLRAVRGPDKLNVNYRTVQSAMSNLADKIAQLLPPELMTRDALENMDVRSLLHQVQLSPVHSTDNDSTNIGGMEFSDMERHVAAMSIFTQTQSLKRTLQGDDVPIDQMNADGTISSEVAQHLDIVDGILEGYREGDIRRVPSAEDRGGVRLDDNGVLVSTNPRDPVANDKAAGLFDGVGEGTEVNIPTRMLSTEDIERMLAGGEIGIEELREIEQADLAGDPTATDPERPRFLDHNARVTFTNEQRITQERAKGHLSSAQEDQMKHGGPSPWKKVESDWYSLNEILSLPGSFTPEERGAMVRRLERAGLLQKGAVLGGDTTSQAFKTAWKTLASSALERGVSMVDLLDEREVAYQESVMDSFTTRLTDPARLRASGDSMAKQSIGRVLTDDEQAKMVEFLHDLERQNAMTEAGLAAGEGANNGVDALDEGITADINARMGEWIKDENAVESEAHNTADQYEQFTRMIGGPGRGI